MTQTTKPAIVLGTGSVALAILRHLAKAKIKRIVHLSTRDFDRSWLTRFSSEKEKVPPPDKDPQGLISYLMDSAKPWDGGLLMPIGDYCARFISRHLDAIETRFRTPILPWNKLEQVMNKPGHAPGL